MPVLDLPELLSGCASAIERELLAERAAFVYTFLSYAYLRSGDQASRDCFPCAFATCNITACSGQSWRLVATGSQSREPIAAAFRRARAAANWAFLAVPDGAVRQGKAQGR